MGVVTAFLGVALFSMANIGASKGTNKAYSDYANALDGMMVTKKYNYEGNPVSFSSNGTIMVNATEMAKPFGKEAKHWLVNQTTKEYIEELANVRNLTFADLVQVKQGSPDNGGGTWMHEDVAMEFARWLSPKFAIWCNDRIKELLTTGKTELKPTIPQTYAEALRQLADEVEAREKTQALLSEKTEQLDESKEWFSIKRWAKIHHKNWRNYNWRKLKAVSHELGYEIKKIFDGNYDEVNIYHRVVFEAVYGK